MTPDVGPPPTDRDVRPAVRRAAIAASHGLPRAAAPVYEQAMLLAATQPELFDRAQWFAATSARREQLARAVADLLQPDLEYQGLRSYAGTDLEIAVYRDVATGMLMSLIPGGEFEMGMSPEEEQAIVDARPEVLDEEDDFNQEFDLLLSEMGTMRPLHAVHVPPFLLAQRVLTVGQVRRFIDGFVDPLYGGEPEVPAHMSSEQAAAVLLGTGMRLPSEAEVEYAARGHLRRCLLPTATRVPDEDALEAMLADAGDVTSNAFGVHGYGLYPERCADAWHEHYKNAPTDGAAWSGPGPRVVRGGAANCYPWQGCGEWNVMLCAFRMSDHAAEFGAAIRPARSLRPPPPLAEPEHAVPPAHRDMSETPPAAEPVAADRPASRKPAAKKATGKKAAAGRDPASKATVTKATAKKATARKATARKAPVTKAAAKKTSAKKASVSKASAKKASAKTDPVPASAKKTSAKQASARKAPVTKASARQASARKAPAQKAAAREAPAQKASAKKAPASRAPARKPRATR